MIKPDGHAPASPPVLPPFLKPADPATHRALSSRVAPGGMDRRVFRRCEDVCHNASRFPYMKEGLCARHLFTPRWPSLDWWPFR